MRYDYIISGAGCAGMSLLVRMIHSGKFTDKKILVIDRELKPRNDRTWCFWEKEDGLFDPIVFRKWTELNFYGENFESLLNITPYTYKMIRGGDFYRYCFEVIKTAPYVELKEGKITSVEPLRDGVGITIGSMKFEGSYCFNSVLFGGPPPVHGAQFYFLKQHFKGLVIRTENPVFNPSVATLMDFRPPQEHGTTFAYVLPYSETTALVEYTLFTRDLLKPEEYDTALKTYIEAHVTKEPYTIEESEFGMIPMTNFPFKPYEGRIVNIGTAGGQTKPSSGYTFQFIQKYTRNIVDTMIASGQPVIADSTSNRFSFYDSTLLQVLDRKKVEGKRLFTDLFRHGDVQTVLKFLDNETSFREDINIMRRLPKGKFAMAALREIFKV
ncbi:MAG TPA: lycopene cyclase family protein [Cyclobacteriaceae bacterium]|nr:lycopene cyclase family protein [Cyclobacteriaceae bacterium]